MYQSSSLTMLSPPWKTRPPTSLVNRRQAAWLTYKRERCSSGRNSAGALAAYKVFSAVNRELRSFGVRSQCDYESSLIDRFRDNPKLLHSYVRNKKVCRPTVGPLLVQPDYLTDQWRRQGLMVGEAHLVGEANIFNVKYIIHECGLPTICRPPPGRLPSR